MAHHFDLATDIYAFLRQWWGLKAERLTATKCKLLARSVREWRASYPKGNYRKLEKMYADDRALGGYLVAFGPRYAYTSYFLLKERKAKRHRICNKGDVLRACYIGGGSVIDIVGLLAYLSEQDTAPRDMELHFIDRSPEWRRFHNSLFGAILPKYFPKTRALPYYHDVDLLDPAPRYDASIHRVFDSRLFVLSNVLSEFADAEPVCRHLRFLLRCATHPCYLVVADSNAKKLRPRLSWLTDFVRELGFPYYVQFSGSYAVSCDWLAKDETSARIFGLQGPSFLTAVSRWGFVAKIIADHPGEDRTHKA
jgi:hypothetical protein